MEALNHWLIQAGIIAAAASAILNGAPFLPWLRDIKPRRIEARWVGYVGTFAAFGLWVAVDAFRPTWQAFAAYGVIWFATVVTNTLVHLRDRDTGGGDRHNLQTVIVLPMERCEEILEQLVDPRRNLTVALETLHSAAVKARRIADLMPDQISRQLWLAEMRESLDEAEARVNEAQEQYLTLFEAVSKAWHVFDSLRRQWGLRFSAS